MGARPSSAPLLGSSEISSACAPFVGGAACAGIAMGGLLFERSGVAYRPPQARPDLGELRGDTQRLAVAADKSVDGLGLGQQPARVLIIDLVGKSQLNPPELDQPRAQQDAVVVDGGR